MLPKLTQPTFTIMLPSSGKKIKLKPFTVKEEKILLMSQQENTLESFFNAILQIVRNSVIDDSIDVVNLPLFDIEYIFVKLRSNSVGNILDIQVFDEEDQKNYETEIDLEKIKVDAPKPDDKKIPLSDTDGIIMRYPSIDVMMNIKTQLAEASVESIFSFVAECIDVIYTEENMYVYKTDFTHEECIDYIDGLSAKDFQKIMDFLDALPQIYYDVTYKNSKGTVTKRLKGMAELF